MRRLKLVIAAIVAFFSISSFSSHAFASTIPSPSVEYEWTCVTDDVVFMEIRGYDFTPKKTGYWVVLENHTQDQKVYLEKWYDMNNYTELGVLVPSERAILTEVTMTNVLIREDSGISAISPPVTSEYAPLLVLLRGDTYTLSIYDGKEDYPGFPPDKEAIYRFDFTLTC